MGAGLTCPHQVSQPLSQSYTATPNCSILPWIPRDKNTSSYGFHMANSHSLSSSQETLLSSPTTTTPIKVQMLGPQSPLPN